MKALPEFSRPHLLPGRGLSLRRDCGRTLCVTETRVQEPKVVAL